MKNKRICWPIFGMLLSLSLISCGEQQNVEKVVLPDLYGLSVRQAKLQVGASFLFEEIQTPTTELIEGRILSYGDGLKAGDVVSKGTRVPVQISQRSEGATANDDSIIAYHSIIAKETGPDSINATILSDAGEYGCDLGIPFRLPDNRMMLLYGDTFSGDNMSGLWFSNYMAITSDTTLYDGITFDSVVTQENGMLQPFAQGAHQNGSENDLTKEVTKIPTGGITVNGNVYIFYMSIRYWGVSGSWLVTYNQALKATDSSYQTWEPVESLRWNESEFRFGGQIYPYQDPNDQEHIYFITIPGGRNDGVVMMRVAASSFENRSEYEYLVGPDQWEKGDTGMAKLNANPYYIIDPAASELSLMWSEYLQQYVIVTLRGSTISMLLSPTITGPYRESHAICSSTEFSGLYGGFVHSAFTDSAGQRMYLQLSRWTPIYNTFLMEVVLTDR